MRKFIQEKLGANDLMAVIHVQGRTGRLAGIHQQQTAAARRGGQVPRQGRAARDRRGVRAIPRDRSACRAPAISDPIERKRGFDARNTLEELQAIADWFGGVRGRRKSILFVSEGIEYDIEDMFNKLGRVDDHAIGRAISIRSATKSNVSIYAIDPRGLTDMGDIGIELNSAPAGGWSTTAATRPAACRAAGSEPRSRGLQNELRLQHNSLRTLAEETGGFAVINTNSFDEHVQTASSRTTARTTCWPTTRRIRSATGSSTTFEVRVNRPGVTVRARRGYANPSGKARRRAVDHRQRHDRPRSARRSTVRCRSAA